MRNDIVYIIAMNTLHVYKMIEALAAQVKKRKDKGLPVTVEHLAHCSTMQTIVRMACRCEESHITKEEREIGAKQIAEYIIEDLAK